MKIYPAKNKYSQYDLKDVEKELLRKVGSRVSGEPAIIVNLGDGESGVIFETDDGDIVMDIWDTEERIWGAENVIRAVLSSWGKSID